MENNEIKQDTSEEHEEMEEKQPNEIPGVNVEGFIKIFDPDTEEVFVEQRNAIHYENFSKAIADSISNQTTGFIHEMHFGNGGTSVSTTGIITYLPANNSGASSDLYNKTYYKVVDGSSSSNTDPTRNKMTITHTSGTIYTDILVTCLLDYGEPAGQEAFDNSSALDGTYVFDELGLKSWEVGGIATGNLLTHVVFHPVQKSLNRLIQIDYTVRIQTLTNLSSAT